MAIDISDVLRRVVYAPNGTGPYQFTFEVLAQTDIAVYRGSTLLTLTTDYTVSLNVDGTGSVTLVTTAGTSNITIVGDRGIARSTDFVTGGDLLANSLNEELDAQTIFNQQTYELALRGLKAPVYDPTDINMTLPAKSSRVGKVLSFDATTGDPVASITANEVMNAQTYATNAANSATAAASSASSASTSASSASSSASTATTQASNASTSASNASTSATNASNSASSASTSASNAATSATNASNSASSASTSATNAASSASAASTSASNASTSATNAANSATAAATSETNAAASAASAAAALDSFDDRYLGAKSSNPTVDNDGNALVTGALYYRTTTPVGMKVYDGAQWIEASAAQQSLMVTYEFVATSGQTTFSGTDANGATLSYVANSISVSLNGVTLRPGDDYTATNGTSVVLNVAAALNDDLMVIAFAVFNVANTYTQSQVDGFTVKLTGNQTVAGTKTFSSDVVANGLTVGRGAGAVATNTAVGVNALAATTGSSSNNTALGSAAGSSLTSGARNTALGFNALLLNTTGAENTAVGGNALNKSTTASGNTALGYVALYETTTGANNVGVGLGALQNNTTASNNTAVGYQAGYSTTTGERNVFVGRQAGLATTGSFNTIVGDNAGYNLTSGTFNTFIGQGSGEAITTGGKHSILGKYNGNSGGLDIRTANNYIVLSEGDGNYSAYGTGGAWYKANNTTTWSTVSDRRIKKNIVPLVGALDKLIALNPVEFDYILNDKHDVSFIAQEYQTVFPEQVREETAIGEEIKELTDGEPLLTLDSNLVPYLVAAIKELSAQVTTLQAEIDALKGQS
jgi:hypothetical protein